MNPILARRASNRILAVFVILGATAINPAIALARAAPDGFADLVDRLSPAVVAVVTERAVPAGRNAPFAAPEGSPFEEFFRRFGGGEEPGGQTRMAAGSGFIIDPAGYVVTNNHVIAGANKVTVTLTDESEYEAQIVGTDERTDLALLKIDAARTLPAVSWGDSDGARVGDWSLAIGNPFGLGGTVTAGIISARGRNINAGIYDFLQTDAPINPGNSGGPLFDLDGAVIGVNSAIYSPSGGNVGIGFAIPSKLAATIVAQIRDHGQAVRGWLGVRIQPLTDDIAAGLGIEASDGALVSQVTTDSPAAVAGVKVGDVITRFADEPVVDARALARLVGATPVDETVAMTVLRDGDIQTLDVTIAVLESAEVASVAPRQPSMSGQLGLAVVPLSPDLRARHGLAPEASGVMVVDVDPTGPAARADIRAGDLIIEAGRQPVTSARDIADAARDAEESGRTALLFLVERDGTAMFRAAPLGVG
jgi:serine protease Do